MLRIGRRQNLIRSYRYELGSMVGLYIREILTTGRVALPLQGCAYDMFRKSCAAAGVYQEWRGQAESMGKSRFSIFLSRYCVAALHCHESAGFSSKAEGYPGVIYAIRTTEY